MADEKKAAFGVFPQMKPRRSKQDREAAKNVPVDLARGVISGALGIPGDLLYLATGLPYELITGKEAATILPTSEDIEKRLPFKSDTPVGGVATGLGQIAGGFATPAPAIRAAKKLRQTIGNLPPADPRMSQMGVIKAPGGNWLTGSVENAVRNLKRTVPMPDPRLQAIVGNPEYTPAMWENAKNLLADQESAVQRAAAINKWIDSNLTNYVKKQMATPDDPVRKLAEEGVLHFTPENFVLTSDTAANRIRAGFPRHGLGKSQAATDWEVLADRAIFPGRVSDLARLGELENNPWLSKLPPETFVHEISSRNREFSDLGFDHIIDVLREDLASGRIRPEQLNKVSMEQAVRRTYEYDQELAKKMQEANAALRAGLPIYKEYPEKFRWIELNKPGSFASESEAMGHSVRGYEPPKGHPDWTPESGESGSLGYGHGGWEAIKSGKAKVYSLVDEKGQPHVTVEVRNNKRELLEREVPWEVSVPLKEKATREAEEIAKANGLSPGSDEAIILAAEKYHDAMFDWRAKNPQITTDITQIKGKQNRAPKEEYLPFVQDFVKSGQWSDVGDLQNTGLVRRGNVFTPTEKRGLIDLGQDVPEYLTQEDIVRLRRARGDLPPEEGMKRGGKVRFTDNPDAMRLELQMAAGGLAKGLKAAAKAAKPAEASIKASEALGRVEGRPLVITQADRTKVGGGYLGGPGFSGLQLTEPEYRAAEAAWGVKTPGVAKMILGGGKAAGKDPVYAAMLGTPTQHQSNQMVFDKLYGDFKKSAKKGNLDPELRDLINTRLASAVDKKGNPVFPPDVDILGKNFKDLANTFDRRAVTANLIGGVTVGGKKGQIIDYDKIIRETTDPLLIEAPTGAVGNRLFTLSGGIIDRPDLHPAFPTILQGEDLGVSFNPVTRDLIMKDFIQQTMREKGRAPGYMDYTRGYPPSQLITEDLLTELQKLGLKNGGKVKITDDPEEMRREMAVGGIVKGLKKAAKASKGTQEILPAAEREANLARFLEPSKVQQRLYHGTMATEGGKGQEAIRSLKPSKEGSLGSGVYMTPSTAQASGYSGSPNAEAIDAMLTSPYQADTALQFLRNQQTGNVLPGQVGGNMLPVYAQLKNPLVIDGSIARDPMVEALMRLGMDKDSAGSMVERAYERKGYIGKEVENRARAAGFDGIMQYRDGELSEVVSYNPSAVKSATGNIGTYDTRVKDLSKAAGGEISADDLIIEERPL